MAYDCVFSLYAAWSWSLFYITIRRFLSPFTTFPLGLDYRCFLCSCHGLVTCHTNQWLLHSYLEMCSFHRQTLGINASSYLFIGMLLLRCNQFIEYEYFVSFDKWRKLFVDEQCIPCNSMFRIDKVILECIFK